MVSINKSVFITVRDKCVEIEANICSDGITYTYTYMYLATCTCSNKLNTAVFSLNQFTVLQLPGLV